MKPNTTNKLAKITKASTGFDHGRLTIWIFVEYEEGMSQGIGGYSLDSYDKALDKRVGTAWGCDLLLRILRSFGVDSLRELEGRHCWVFPDNAGLKPLRVDKGSGESIEFREGTTK